MRRLCVHGQLGGGLLYAHVQQGESALREPLQPLVEQWGDHRLSGLSRRVILLPQPGTFGFATLQNVGEGLRISSGQSGTTPGIAALV